MNNATLIRRIEREDLDPLLIDGARHALKFAQRAWNRIGYARTVATDATDEGITQGRKHYGYSRYNMKLGKPPSRFRFPSFVDLEDIQEELLCSLVLNVRNWAYEHDAKYPLSEEEYAQFHAFLNRCFDNDIQQIARYAQIHDGLVAESLDDGDGIEGSTLSSRNGISAGESVAVDEVAVADPLYKTTEDIAESLCGNLYAEQFLKTLTDRQRFIVLTQMQDLDISNAKIAKMLHVSAPVIRREKIKIAAQLFLFDPERIPKWLSFLQKGAKK